MLFTFAGIVRLCKLSHCANAYFEIDVTLEGIVTDSKLLQ